MTSFATSADGVPIAYAIHGAGTPAFVFVHGWSCNRSYWDSQVDALASHTAIVTLDLAGHGESGVTRELWSIAAFGADVVAVIDALALDDVILIGHSMGVDVALEAARGLRGRVRGLVWVDQYKQLTKFMSESTLQERLEPFRTQFSAATQAFVRRLFLSSSNPALVERVSADMSSSPPHVALAALEATWRHGWTVPAILSEIGLPVVTINAQTTPTDLKSMNDHGVEVILMPEVGHFPMVEKPDEFNTCLIRAFQMLNVR